MSNPSSSQPQQVEKKDPSSFCCNPFKCRYGRYRIPQRFVVAILLHLCLQNNFNTRVVLNVAIVEMVEPPIEDSNATLACPQYEKPNVTHHGQRFPWPRATSSLVLYAFYFGYTLLQVPGGWLADKFGARYVFGTCVFLTTIITAVFPILAQKWGYLAAVGLRLLLGFAHAPTMPAVSSMVSTWYPPKERARWGGFSYAGTNLGTILGSVVSGALIHKFDGWPVAFYFWSAYSAFYFVLLLMFLFSFPDTHPFISEEEAEYIRVTNAGNRSLVGRSLKTPWKAILLNRPYLANVVAQFGHNYIYFTLITYLPTYMREILQFDVANDGYFSAIPFFALWVTSLILSGTVHYFLRCMSQENFNKFFGAGSNVVSALLVLGAVYAGCNRYICISLYIISMIIKAFYYVTLPVNINALSRNYGGILYGFCNTLGSISGIIGNLIIGTITKDHQIHGWKVAFWITLGVALFTTVIFFLFTSAERQDFDYAEDEERETQN